MHRNRNSHSSRFTSHRSESVTPMKIALPPMDLGLKTNSKIDAPKVGRAAATEKTRQDQIYVSPRELAERLRVSRTEISRIAHREKWKRVCLGHGRNRSVRYLWSEVLASEKMWTFDPKLQTAEI
jgi:hypothetical protein